VRTNARGATQATRKLHPYTTPPPQKERPRPPAPPSPPPAAPLPAEPVRPQQP